MTILCTVDLETREVALPSGQRIASYDHNVDVIRFQVEAIPGFSLDTSSIKIAAQGPNKARHDYAVDPSTVAIEEETGYITFDWPIPADVTEMPIGTFKYGDRGQLIFAVCAEIISGSTVSKAWHSDDGIITVVAHLEPEAGGGEDPSETATNAQKIAQLQTDVAVINTQVGALGNGSPAPVATVAEMTDESAVYLYTGSETGYTAGNWYYYDGTAWTSGGTYGGAVTSTTFTEHGVPADDFAVGEALAEKADADDLTAIDNSIGDLSQLTTTAKNNLVSAINETDGAITEINGYLNPLFDSNVALEFEYKCTGYYYNSGAKRIMSSANLETFKYNIPDDCVTVRIQSNFYASQIMLSNTDTTSATFPSMSINLNEIVLRPATAPGSATNVDITYNINDDNRYKYLYVPHYVGDTNLVVVTATMRGEISSLTYEKIDAAGRYRRNVPTGEDIFTSEGFTSGYILSNGQGGTTSNPNYGYTDYINIEGNSFTLDGISGNGFSVVYDENKNPLGSGAISLFFDKNDRPDGTKYIRFNVYLANLPSVKMNVYDVEWITYITPSQVVGGYTNITVGTGKQFTSVVEAVEYANSIASDYNTVNVYIYPGTYDIIGEYDLSEQVSSWNGLTLTDYVNLIGVGSPDKVILKGELPTDISSYAFDRNNVSTLNFWKNNNIKNLTITAKNMRYCLHNEDGKVYAVENAVEMIENCVFVYYENDADIISSRVPVGIGAAAGRKTTFKNCVFDNQSANGNYSLLLHNNTNAEKYCSWVFDSCNFVGGIMNSLKLSSAGSGQTELVNIMGCRLPKNIRFDRQNVYTGTVCEYKVFGHGNAINGTASWDGVAESASVTEMLIN